MIQINLLPPELKKRERTPLAVFLPFVACLATTLTVAAFAAWVHFDCLAEAVNEHAQNDSVLAQRQPQLKYEKSLLAEERDYKSRADTIRNIAGSRLLMTRRLDELFEIIESGKEDGHLIWLTSLKMAPAPENNRRIRGRKGPEVGGSLTLKGFALAESDPLHSYNIYHANIKQSRMFRLGYNDIGKPKGKVNIFTDGKLPSKGWSIGLTMTMAHPRVRAERIEVEERNNVELAQEPTRSSRRK